MHTPPVHTDRDGHHISHTSYNRAYTFIRGSSLVGSTTYVFAFAPQKEAKSHRLCSIKYYTNRAGSKETTESTSKKLQACHMAPKITLSGYEKRKAEPCKESDTTPNLKPFCIQHKGKVYA
jgi:hypothetical protein